MNPKFIKVLISVLIGIIVSFPLTGFIHGFITASGTSESFFETLKGRSIIGLFEAIANTVSYGSPFGDGHPANINVRIYTFITAIVVAYFIYYKLSKKRNKKINGSQQRV